MRLRLMMLSMIYEGRFSTFYPVTDLEDIGIKLIRPFVFVTQAEAVGFRNKYELPVAVKYNELTVGELLKFVVYLGMLQSPIEFLSWVTNWWARCIDSVRRVFEITDSKPDIEERENAVDIKDLNGDIEISKLTFSYEPARPVIKNLSLKIDAGKMLGIVGKTGAGKTTISNLNIERPLCCNITCQNSTCSNNRCLIDNRS